MSQLMTGRRLGGLTAAVLGSQALAGGTGAGTGGGRQDPQAMAGKAAAALIQSRAPELKIGKHDGFVAQNSNLNKASGYALRSFNVSSFAGPRR